jgi:hypothetical protein
MLLALVMAPVVSARPTLKSLIQNHFLRCVNPIAFKNGEVPASSRAEGAETAAAGA